MKEHFGIDSELDLVKSFGYLFDEPLVYHYTKRISFLKNFNSHFGINLENNDEFWDAVYEVQRQNISNNDELAKTLLDEKNNKRIKVSVIKDFSKEFSDRDKYYKYIRDGLRSVSFWDQFFVATMKLKSFIADKLHVKSAYIQYIVFKIVKSSLLVFILTIKCLLSFEDVILNLKSLSERFNSGV